MSLKRATPGGSLTTAFSIPEENQDTRESSNVGCDQSNAITARRSATKPSSARTLKYAPGAPRRATTMATAVQWWPSASCTAARTNRSAGPASGSTHPTMSRTLRLIQLNVRKQGMVYDSLMNDKDIQDVTVLAIQEPQVRMIYGRLLTTPIGHYKWIKIVPLTWREGR